MLAHVYQFRTFGPSAPWVYGAIAFGLVMIVAVHVYRTVRRRRHRNKARSSAAEISARPILPVDPCQRDDCPVFPHTPGFPGNCPVAMRLKCKEGLPTLHDDV
jgi:hypothetical protein